MNRRCGALLVLLLWSLPGEALGQFNPYAPPVYDSSDPRVRRAAREQAVAHVGPGARAFVEAGGDEAVAAIFACSRPVAVKLCEFHASGALEKLSRPRDLLRAIAQPKRGGDDVALWAVRNANVLEDTDNLDAFLANPLEYALGLSSLAAGAADMRARRLNDAAQRAGKVFPDIDWKLVAWGAGGFGLAVALLWRQRRFKNHPMIPWRAVRSP